MREFVIGFVLGLAVCLVPMWFRDSAQTQTITALERSVGEAKAARAAAIETVTVHQPVLVAVRQQAEAVNQLVAVVDATTLAVKLTPSSATEFVSVPPIVVRKMRMDSVLIATQADHIGFLSAVLREDSEVILQQDSLITTLKKGRRCGAKCGAAITLGMLIIVDQAPKLAKKLLSRDLALERPVAAPEVRDKPASIRLGHPIGPLQLP